MKRYLLLAAALGLAISAAARAGDGREPVAEDLRYRAYIGGLPLGTLHLGVAMDPERYAVRGAFEMAALLRWILDTDAKASASGGWREGRPLPQSFDYWVRDRKKRRTSEMRFDEAGDPVEIMADPPFRQRSYQMTIDEARGAYDPATAAVRMMMPREAACDLELRVFDGRKLHGISLRPSDTPPENGYVLCEGHYERLAGFKAKHMVPEERSYDFKAVLREVEPKRWRPVKVAAKTRFGSATAVLLK